MYDVNVMKDPLAISPQSKQPAWLANQSTSGSINIVNSFYVSGYKYVGLITCDYKVHCEMS